MHLHWAESEVMQVGQIYTVNVLSLPTADRSPATLQPEREKERERE